MLSALVLTCMYFVFLSIADSHGVEIHDLNAEDYMGENINGPFFRYDGGLTIPGCFESVIWTVFKDPVQIEEDEVWFDILTHLINLAR